MNTAELFIQGLFGHLIGDFLLQTKSMALGKSLPGKKGALICSIHSLIYTISICLMLWSFNPIIWFIIFVTHWVMDRWSLGNYWLKLIKGRTFEKAFNSIDKYREFDVAFTSIVYTVVDNTFHLLVIWIVVRFI